MNSFYRQLFLLFLFTITTSNCFAADIKSGKSLHDANCINCHAQLVGGDGTGIYTRENRKIDTFAQLDKQVRRCRDSLGMSWPEEQIMDVVMYLNKTFYHFKEE